MKLKKIQIKNFRSIKDAEIVLDHNCLILLGKNEAGKSNILKAIAAVFGEYKVSQKDKRKKINNEKIEHYYVRAIFDLTENDISEMMNYLNSNYSWIDRVQFKNRKTLESNIKEYLSEFIVKVIIDGDSPPYLSFWTQQIRNIAFQSNYYFDGKNVSTQELPEKLEIRKVLTDGITFLYEKYGPQCHYWHYSEDYLLPASVEIDKFLEEPESFPALHNIFTLCGREDIAEEFEEADAQDGDYANLLDQVSETVTSTFKKIWRDFNKTSIKLIPDGEKILIKVVDKTKYSFEDRSDGFKKIMSILLMLSTRSRADKLTERDLILIDEPDQSLYPTSADHLKRELLQISKKSIVIYTTHSQYMIDTDCIGRHVVVEKNDDITSVIPQNDNAPFSNDELLRRAIGSSIFECLKPMNIIFEGYLDKLLFDKYCEFYNCREQFEHIGKVYLGGINGAETLIQLLILANKKFVLISDSDEVSRSKRADFNKHYPELKNNWIAYGDHIDNVFTMEDFINTEIIGEEIAKHNLDYKYDKSKSAMQNIDRAFKNDKDQKQVIKNAIMEGIKKENIQETYAVYIDKMAEKLGELKDI